ncbi:hypothetical protein MYAM1_000646 [Malassezia yamatoensis]|uniref:Uncharacterized protein n=1 Tax=Malassezia yamatoensis TaxID=253288 RepID=A0AAJ5YSE7_9BASI|nr:hypothetical protein MYAM1_000646 [Malassezia yamatoensis]
MPGAIRFDGDTSPLPMTHEPASYFDTGLAKSADLVAEPETLLPAPDTQATIASGQDTSVVDMPGSTKEQEQEAVSVASPSKVAIAPPEQLIIVQPSLKRQHHHPHNLQIQLISRGRTNSNPNSDSGHEGTRSRSNSSTSAHSTGILRRANSTSSARSIRSDSPGASSSVASLRRAIPLYNLDFHQIRATHILDAGTDQNVAKFTRKGVEIEGFGLLQPQEKVYHSSKMPAPAIALPLPLPTHDIPASHTVAELSESRNSSESSRIPDTHAAESSQGTLLYEDNVETPHQKLFSRIRKFGKHLRPNRSTDEKSELSRAQSFHAMPRSAAAPALDLTQINEAQDPTTFQTVSPTALTHAQGQSQAVAHLSPGAGIANGKITSAYVWHIKKLARNDESRQVFTKSDPHAMLSQIWRQFNSFAREGHAIEVPPPRAILPYFEWVRDFQHSPASTRQPSPDASLPTTTVTSNAEISTQPALSSMTEPRSSPPILGDTSSQPLPNTTRARTPSPQRRGSDSPVDNSEPQYTSWTFFLVLDDATRIPIGQLTPAPHHPLVVCKVSLPSPLPDLRHTALGFDQLGFSREELRDIVVVTSVHLVIRESIGSLQGIP